MASEQPGRPIVITREQQEDLDPVLGEAMLAADMDPRLADLVMRAYKLGRKHGAASGGAILAGMQVYFDSAGLMSDADIQKFAEMLARRLKGKPDVP